MKNPNYIFEFIGLAVLISLASAGTPLFAELTLHQPIENTLVIADDPSNDESETPLVMTSVVMQPVTITDAAPSSNLDIEEPVLVLDQGGEVRIDGRLLNYPNPFSYNDGHTTIGYFLTTAGDIRLQIYSLTGYLLYTADFAAETPGAQGGVYNRIRLDKFSFGSAVLSPGVYIYTLVHGNKVLGKNKMVVLP